MERKDQIEQLAKAWEACGDGRGSRTMKADGLTYVIFSHIGNRFLAKFLVDDQDGYISNYASNDTMDASPCLALLRDVKGEDCHINMAMGDVSAWVAWERGPEELGLSTVSRILATASVLESQPARDTEIGGN